MPASRSRVAKRRGHGRAALSSLQLDALQSPSRCMGSRRRGPLRQAEEPRWHRDAPEADRARRGVALGTLRTSHRPGRRVALLCGAVRRRVRSRDALSPPQPGDAESLARPTGTTRLFHVEQPRRRTPLAGCQTNQTGYPGGLPVPMAHAHHGGVFRRCQRSASPIWPFPVPRGTSPQRTWPWSTAVRQTRARQSYDGRPPMSAATRPLEIPGTTAIMPVARRSFPTAVARCYLSTSRAPHAGERRSLAGRSGWAGRRPAVRASQDVGRGWPGDDHAADPGRTGRPWNASPHRGALVRMP